MKLKSILYKKEQDELVDKIINILELNNENSIILYNLDNDKLKQDKIDVVSGTGILTSTTGNKVKWSTNTNKIMVQSYKLEKVSFKE